MSRIMKKVDKADLFFGFMMIGVVIVHLSRIRLGMVELDESFYLTIPLRLIQGDALLVDEWNMGQMFGVLLFPILKIYLAIVGTTEGIYLAFRYIWLACAVLTAIVSYLLLRRKDKYIGAVSSAMISLFTYACIRALSYNTMITMAIWLFVVLSITETRFYKTKYITMGLLFAVAVLCNPYILLYYVGYAIICFVKKENGYFGLKSLGFITLGGAIAAFPLMVLVFSRASLFEILENLGGVLYNPSHKMKTFFSFFEPIIDFVVWFKLYFIFFAIGLIVLIWGKKLKKLAFAGLTSLSCVLWILLLLFKTDGVGRFAIYLPLTMMGAAAFMCTKKKDWIIFGRGWITGIVLACCMNLASNQGIYAILDACIICAGVSLFLIKDYLKENKIWFEGKWWLIIFAGMQIFAQVWINLNSVFWENDISELKYELETGPMKGVYTTESKKNNYEINCRNIEELGDLTGKYVMFFNHFPAGYLFVPEARNGAFSSWMTEYDTPDNQQFINYYTLHPERVPDVVYFDVDTECTWDQEQWEDWCNANGF